MQIHISEKFNATAMSTLLGYVGETNARAIEVKHPVVEGADTYRLRFEYSDGVVYDVPIVDGKVVVTGSFISDMTAYIEEHKDEFKGDPGENGKTPVKGVDYFTTQDKQEIIDAVYNMLPIYDGGVE